MSSKVLAYVCSFQDKNIVSVKLLTKAESVALWIIESYGHFNLHTSPTNDGSYKGDFRLEGDSIPDDTAIFFHCRLDEPQTFAKLNDELDGWLPEGDKGWSIKWRATLSVSGLTTIRMAGGEALKAA